MLASPGMRLARELASPLTLALALAGGAMFFGGGAGDTTLPWLGTAAVVLALILLARQGVPRGITALAPLGLFAAWCTASLAWSIEPDRTWSYANRTLVYAAFALVGALLAAEPRRLLYGLAALLGAVCVWSLVGKTLPWLYEDYGRIARLRGPIGYWNSLALLGDIALPIGLCLAARRRTAGALLVFGWLVAIGLTYSRTGVGLALVVVAAWILFSGAWVDALATLVSAALPAAGVLVVAFSLPALTSDGQPHAARVRDGLVFAAVVLVDAAIVAALARFGPPANVSSTVRRILVGLLAAGCVGAIVLGGLDAHRLWDSFTSSSVTELPNSPSRLADSGSNFRWAWWQQAWRGFEHNELKGTGAGSFQFTNLRYRTTSLDATVEPHDLPLQFLSETGIIGAVLFALALASLALRARRRPGPQLALALALPIFLLHGLLDIDWDFAAVAAPVFLIAGALAVRPEAARQVSRPNLLALSGVGLALVCSLFAVWLGNRWTNEAGNVLGVDNAKALSLVQKARTVDPLSIEPLFDGAVAESSIAGLLGAGKDQRAAYAAALSFLTQATQLQPANAQAWQELGWFNLYVRGCPRAALPELSRFTVLDGQNPANVEYAAALKEVNAGTYDC